MELKQLAELVAKSTKMETKQLQQEVNNLNSQMKNLTEFIKKQRGNAGPVQQNKQGYSPEPRSPKKTGGNKQRRSLSKLQRDSTLQQKSMPAQNQDAGNNKGLQKGKAKGKNKNSQRKSKIKRDL